MRTKISTAVKMGLRGPKKTGAPSVAPPDDETKGHEEKTANELNEALWSEIEGRGSVPTRFLDAAPLLEGGSVKVAAKPPHVPTPPGGWKDILPSLSDSFRTIVTGKGEIGNAQKMQLGLIGAVGATALGAAYYNARQKAKQRQYDGVIHHILQAPDMQDSASWQSVVPEAYAFMQRYAPQLSQDRSIASAFCRMVHAGDKDNFLNFRVAKELAESEKAYTESGSTQGALKDIEALLRNPIGKAMQMGGGGGGKK